MSQRFADPSAEQAVLGALMSDASCWDEIAGVFRPELFSDPYNRAIADEVWGLMLQQKPADPVMVLSGLTSKRAEVPAEYVLGVARSSGSSANAKHYTETLVSLWLRRQAMEIARGILNDDGETEGAEYLAHLAERISALETQRGKAPQKLGALIVDRLDVLEQQQKHPETVGAGTIATGFKRLDDLLGGGLHPGHMTILAARPGVGKSALVSAMADNLAARQIPVGIFQLEDYGESLANRAIMRRAKINSTLMRDGSRWNKGHWDKIASWVLPTLDHPIYVDDQHQRTIHDITAAMRRMVKEHGVRVFFLDNLAEVVVDRQDRNDERLDRALGRISKQYRDAANALGVVPVLVVHLNREGSKRKDQAPVITDIKNSGEIEDAAHVVALLWRPPEAPGKLLLDLGKNRDGPPGRVMLDWLEDYMAVKETQP